MVNREVCMFVLELHNNNHSYLLFTSWSANKVIGPPDVYPQYGDFENAWASESANSVEFIEVNRII